VEPAPNGRQTFNRTRQTYRLTFCFPNVFSLPKQKTPSYLDPISYSMQKRGRGIGQASRSNRSRSLLAENQLNSLLNSIASVGGASARYSCGSAALPFFLPNRSFAVKIFSVANSREAMYIMTTVKTAT
jgi:hypothetical protein